MGLTWDLVFTAYVRLMTQLDKILSIAAIAQLAARRSHNPKVVSSILTRRILECKVATSNHPIIESLNVLIT